MPTVRGRRWARGSGGILPGSTLAFYAPLLSDLDSQLPSTSETHARNSSAWVPDYEGIYRQCYANFYLGVDGTAVPAFGGARLWHNIMNDATFLAAEAGVEFTESNSSVADSTADTPTGGPATVSAWSEDGTAATTHALTDFLNTSYYEDYGEYVLSMYVKPSNRDWIQIIIEQKDGTDVTAYFNASTGSFGTTANTLATGVDDIGNGWYRPYIRFSAGTGASSSRFFLYIGEADNDRTFDGLSQESLLIGGYMLEKVGGQADKTPSAFLETDEGPHFEWLTTGHDGSGIAAATLKGLLRENNSENLITYSRDLSNAAWTKTNTAVDADEHAGPDGNLRITQEVRATAINGTVSNSLTVASAEHTCSAFIKRVTGTGTVEISADGTTWVDITSSLTTSYQRFSDTRTTTAPGVYVRLGTSGDEVAIDFAQLEAQDRPTSFMLTEAATATRPDEQLNYGDPATWFDNDEGMIVAIIEPTFTGARGGARMIQSISGSNLFFYIQSDTQDLRSYDGVNLSSFTVTLTEGTPIKVGLRWNAAQSIKQICADGTADTEDTYDGAYALGTNFNPGSTSANAGGDFYIKELFVYSRDLGQSSLEALTS